MSRKYIKTILIVFFLSSLKVFSIAQPHPIGLTQKNRDKINSEKSIEKRLKLYTKYIHKDSARFIKETDHYWQHKLDSIHGLMAGKKKKLNDKKQELVQRMQNPLHKASARLQLTEEMYRFPKELERRYTPDELKVIYSSARDYLAETSKDTLNPLAGKFAIPSSMASRTDKLKEKAGVKMPSVDNPVNGLKGKATGMVQGKIGNNEALGEVKELSGEAKEYLAEYQKYNGYANMSPDSLKQMALQQAEAQAQGKLMDVAGLKEQQSQMKEFNEIKAMQNQYKSQMTQVQDSTARKEMLKQKAEEAAMKYLQDNPSALKTAQNKMELLMKKYSFVPNSNDLSTAVKRTSLKGKSFKERLVVAANFQLLSIDPVSIDLSPQLGYKFNTRFAMGVGGTYRQTFNDSVPTLSPQVFGYKGFTSYELFKSFFAYGEYTRNSPGVEVREGISKRIWKPAALLGIGRKFAIHKKIDMTVVALYNFLYERPDPIYPRAFVVRVGFQLSDIALLKRKPELKW